MEVHIALPNHLLEIQELVSACIEDMEDSGITQWNTDYPGVAIFEEDVEKGQLFLMIEEERIIGIIALVSEQDPEYANVNWLDKDGKALVIHRLAVHPAWQKRGVARGLMGFADEYASKNGFSSIRIDTHSQNTRMKALIENSGFTGRGEIFFVADDVPYFCYEKQLR